MPALRSKSKQKQAEDSVAKAVTNESKGKSKTPGDVQHENEKDATVDSNPNKKRGTTIAPSTPAGAKTPPAGMKSPAVLIEEHQLPLPPTRTSETPSPHQVISDCVDATCHEVMMINNLSFDAYSVLAQRLDYYMELLDHGMGVEDDDVELVLKEAHMRNRLHIARLVISMCSRPSYEQNDCPVPPLINFSQEEWKVCRDEMNSLFEIMKDIFAGGKKTQSKRLAESHNLYVSILRRIEAMEALVHLKTELAAFLKGLEEDEPKQTISFNHPKDCIAEYIKTADSLRSDLQTIHRTRYDDFFIPNKVLPQINLNDTDGAKESLTSFVNKLSVMVTKHAFPLQKIQNDFVRLARECNHALPEPAFFKVGYFGELKMPAKELSAKAQKENEELGRPSAKCISSPVKDITNTKARKSKIYDDSSEDEEPPMKVVKRNVTSPAVAKARNKRKREQLIAIKEKISSTPISRKSLKSPQVVKKESPVRNIARGELSFDSDSDMKASSVSSIKRKRRVPYSDLEKSTLMKGVERFGVGSWSEIRSYYDDVFKQNGRTNVNLKDLYRTLTK